MQAIRAAALPIISGQPRPMQYGARDTQDARCLKRAGSNRSRIRSPESVTYVLGIICHPCDRKIRLKNGRDVGI